MNIVKHTFFPYTLSVLFILISIPLQIAAQTEIATSSEASATTTPLRDTLENRREAVRASTTARLQALSNIRQERIINLSANLSNRLEAAIDRLFAIVGRLESRLTKIETSGKDVSQAKASLRRAAEQLGSARAAMNTIDTQVVEATTANDAAARWQTVRTTYTNTATLIRAARESLREVVMLTKRALQEPVVTEVATTSSELSE